MIETNLKRIKKIYEKNLEDVTATANIHKNEKY